MAAHESTWVSSAGWVPRCTHNLALSPHLPLPHSSSNPLTPPALNPSLRKEEDEAGGGRGHKGRRCEHPSLQPPGTAGVGTLVTHSSLGLAATITLVASKRPPTISSRGQGVVAGRGG